MNPNAYSTDDQGSTGSDKVEQEHVIMQYSAYARALNHLRRGDREEAIKEIEAIKATLAESGLAVDIPDTLDRMERELRSSSAVSDLVSNSRRSCRSLSLRSELHRSVGHSPKPHSPTFQHSRQQAAAGNQGGGGGAAAAAAGFDFDSKHDAFRDSATIKRLREFSSDEIYQGSTELSANAVKAALLSWNTVMFSLMVTHQM